MLLKLKDGGILNIEYDSDYFAGCSTCDYGSNYINDYDINLTNFSIRIRIENMYDYLFSEGDMLKLFLSNIEEIVMKTEEEFTLWIDMKMKEYNADKISVDIYKKCS
jgi:hypothetical protein